MAGKRVAKVPKNDFEYDEGEVCGFSSEAPLTGDCISSFSFDDDFDIYNIQTNSECKSNNDTGAYENSKTNIKINTAPTSNSTIQNNITNTIEIKNTLSSTKDIFANRRTPLPNGADPAINGENPTIKRSYTLRISTIRKINKSCSK